MPETVVWPTHNIRVILPRLLDDPQPRAQESAISKPKCSKIVCITKL